jgi:large subunit ribosomal protein L22
MLMEGKARGRFIRMSPRKVRLVADLVRGRKVDEAVSILKNTRKRAALPVRKVVHSAASNAISAVGTGRLRAQDLEITRILVDGGPSYKRYRAAPMGRAHLYKHRLCHITVVVAGEAREERRRRGKPE